MNKIAYVERDKNLNESRALKNFEIVIFISAGKLRFADREYSVQPDSCYVIPPRINHFIGSAKNICIGVEKAVLPFKEITKICDSDNEILNAATQLCKYFKKDVSKKELIISALGETLIAFITAFSDACNYSPTVAALIAEINDNVSRYDFSLEDAINKLPLNYDYMRKLFKKEVGLNPHEYLIQARMKLAKQLILSGVSNQYTNFSVSQIAEACGFAEPLYFSRVFKKQFGVAPSEYGK